jgi:hypothetical protein
LLMQRFSFQPKARDMHPNNVEYGNTLAVRSVWGNPCGCGRKW